ncbi:MAG: GrpB family protein [Sporolactobacillus sp.]|nr:GrpB family protein [Sporolactobacillus sp.]
MPKLVNYSGKWETDYRREADRITGALRPFLHAVHHIGSTAVQGMPAVPIIDILAEVTCSGASAPVRSQITRLGYVPAGQQKAAGAEIFNQVDHSGALRFCLYLVDAEAGDAVRFLALRDYLRTHADDATFYGALKEKLAGICPVDKESYQTAKAAACAKLETLALEWWYGN